MLLYNFFNYYYQQSILLKKSYKKSLVLRLLAITKEFNNKWIYWRYQFLSYFNKK
jgi:hypothetical protein